MANLVTADRAEADKGGPYELLACKRGSTSDMAILNKSGKSCTIVEAKRPTVEIKKVMVT
jgi:hypothetical protein